jgi:hypothetical protein
MRSLVIAVALAGAAPALASPQAPVAGPAIQKEKALGVEVRFVNTPWRPDIFQAMEEGGPAARGWAFARLSTQAPFAIDERPIPPGHYVLVLSPKAGSISMSLELRKADNREIFVDVNTMPPPPGGETLYKAPAAFTISTDPTPVLDVTLAGWTDGVSLTVRYGNRKLTKNLVRAAP